MRLLQILLFLSLILQNCTPNTNQKLIIASSANMRFAIEEIVQSFEEQSQIDCELILGSSGKLTTQIKENAPFNIFLSADQKYPQALWKDSLTVSSPQTYAYGKLILWSLKSKPSLSTLTQDSITHIAMANPNHAPYGMAAMEALKQTNVYNRVKDKLVYGEDISQTNSFISTYNAQVGFTALSTVYNPHLQNKGTWITIDSLLYTPIAQDIVIIKKEKSNYLYEEKFLDFLFSNEGKEILNKFGYTIP